MTNDVAEYQGGAVTAAPEWVSKIELVKRLVAKGCSNDEFELLCYVAQKHDLDPLAGDVWMIPFQGGACKPTVGFHGLIRIAHRTGQLDGIEKGTETVDGELFHWATIWRKDCSHPFTARIRAKEYDQSRNPLWKGKPWTMGEKVAASHALRLAFTLDGLYIPEEIESPAPRVIADTSRTVSAIVEPPKAMTKTQPAEICHNLPDAGPVLRCDVCGRSNADYPDLPIRERDGKMICGPCHRKATAQITHVVEPAPAPVKAVPKPAAKVAAPSGDAVAVCEECGAPVTDAQRKTSMLFVTRCLCSRCIDQVNGPQPGEQGFAS